MTDKEYRLIAGLPPKKEIPQKERYFKRMAKKETKWWETWLADQFILILFTILVVWALKCII